MSLDLGTGAAHIESFTVRKLESRRSERRARTEVSSQNGSQACGEGRLVSDDHEIQVRARPARQQVAYEAADRVESHTLVTRHFCGPIEKLAGFGGKIGQ